jgi:hypothetical protein
MKEKILMVVLWGCCSLKAHMVHRLVWDDAARGQNEQKPEDIVARISFDKRNYKKSSITYADVSEQELLKVCPLDTMPEDLKKVVSDLVNYVKVSVQHINDARKNSCQSLQEQLTQTQNDLSTALSSQYFLSSSMAASSGQSAINAFTRQATAVNKLGIYGSNFLKAGCALDETDKTMIQRLMGQALTLGGLFLGGWQGIGVAGFGQLFASLPLFRNHAEKAQRDLNKYEENNEKLLFLCWYRQVLKVSTLLFMNQNNKIINGIDMSFETGPVKVTLDTLSAMDADDHDSLVDVKLLSQVVHDADAILKPLESAKGVNRDLWPALNQIKTWCSDNKPENSWHNATLKIVHPPRVEQSFYYVAHKCHALSDLKYPKAIDLEVVVERFYRSLMRVKEYYAQLAKNDQGKLGKMASTWESMKFFEKTEKTMSMYKNSEAGNLLRLNYRSLSEKLGKGLSRDSFSDLMKDYKSQLRPHRKSRQVHLLKRQRIVRAMVATCQTFDPSIGSFGVDNIDKSKFFKSWREHCVGPRSTLCKKILFYDDKDELLAANNDKDRASNVYFYSLCGSWKKRS